MTYTTALDVWCSILCVCVCFILLPGLFWQIRPAVPPPSCVLILETQAARRWRTVGLTCSGEKREPKHGTATPKLWHPRTYTHIHTKRKQKGGLRDWPWQRVRAAAVKHSTVITSHVRSNSETKKKNESNKNKGDVRRQSPAEKVSIAVSSQCGAVCRGRLRAAVEYSRTQLSSGYSHCQWLKWQGEDRGEILAKKCVHPKTDKNVSLNSTGGQQCSCTLCRSGMRSW